MGASFGEPLLNNIWNEKPQQAVDPIWGNPLERRTSETRIRITQRVDTLGNMVRDTVKVNSDSAAAAGSVDVSYDAPPPPDDPTDAPLDNGICLLLAIGLVHGYNMFGRKKTGKKTATVKDTSNSKAILSVQPRN